MFSRTATIMLAAASTIAAQDVIVIIEASHGGAGNGLTNTSITVPLNIYYTDPKLDAVSTLFLAQAEEVELDAVTCTPYRNANASGSAGLPFNSTTPSFISTNTQQVGSLFCTISTDNSTSSGTPSLTPTFPNSTMSTTTAHTSVLLTTVSGPVAKVTPTTITSVATFSGANGPTTSTFTSVINVPQSTSASAGLNSQGAAPTRAANWMAGAIAGFGLMAAL